MNRASKMGGSLSRNMLLRKKVDYQEECLLRKIVVLERTDDLKSLKVWLIHVIGKVLFL